MLLNIRLSDETYAAYGFRNPKAPAKEIERTLEAFKALDPDDARVVLSGPELQEVSKILGHPISSVKELLEHLRRSESVAFPQEGITLELSPDQRFRLSTQAKFMQEDYVSFAKKQIQAGVQKVTG